MKAVVLTSHGPPDSSLSYEVCDPMNMRCVAYKIQWIIKQYILVCIAVGTEASAKGRRSLGEGEDCDSLHSMADCRE